MSKIINFFTVISFLLQIFVVCSQNTCEVSNFDSKKLVIKVETSIQKNLTEELHKNFEQFKIEAHTQTNKLAENLKVLAEQLHEQLKEVNELKNVFEEILPDSCESAMNNSKANDGFYTLNLPVIGLPAFNVNCKRINGQIWTIIQRRQDGSVNFYRNWSDYRNGFGNLYGEFWLGLEKIHKFTTWRPHELKIWLKCNEEEKWANYKKFVVGNEEEKYKLTINDYDGTAGENLKFHNGMMFSTMDKDNDLWNDSCADDRKGAWWFNDCAFSHLNGDYHGNDRPGDGIYWSSCGQKLKYSEMAIRRLD